MEIMNMTNEEYKQLSIKEFTEAAKRYEGDHAGLYEMCKKDYPDILEELEKEPFIDILDAGCGFHKTKGQRTVCTGYPRTFRQHWRPTDL